MKWSDVEKLEKHLKKLNKIKMAMGKNNPRFQGTRLKRVCDGCGDMYRPSGKFCKLCDKCLEKSKEEMKKKKKGE